MLVAITGYRRDGEELDAAGFHHHLVKPVDMQDLSEILQEKARLNA